MWVRLLPRCNPSLMSAIAVTTKDEFIQVEDVQNNERIVFQRSNQHRMGAGFYK